MCVTTVPETLKINELCVHMHEQHHDAVHACVGQKAQEWVLAFHLVVISVLCSVSQASSLSFQTMLLWSLHPIPYHVC